MGKNFPSPAILANAPLTVNEKSVPFAQLRKSPDFSGNLAVARFQTL